MPDTLTRLQRHNCMSRIRGKNTKPEILVRKGLHARGFRFRLHNKKLPGSPDVVLVKSKFSTNNFKKIRIPQFSETRFGSFVGLFLVYKQ